MYFKSRVDAGQQLAQQMKRYKDERVSIIALSNGGAVVAAQIAKALHCPIMMLMTKPIKAPGEPEAVASINQEGTYAYNSSYSQGELEEFDMEYSHIFEQNKLDEMATMHRLLGRHSIIRRDLIRGHIIVLVSDGLNSSFTLDAAVLYLKATKIKKLIIATPLASIPAIDKMHILADELYCLSTVDRYIETNHYYDNNDMPSPEVIISSIQHIVQNWQK